MTNVKKRRIFSLKELGVPSWKDYCSIARICFSQDEEYLIICLSNAVIDKNNMVYTSREDFMNDILIIQIGSLSDFFSGSPINVKAVLQLKNINITFI